jgi:hypothetical protein
LQFALELHVSQLEVDDPRFGVGHGPEHRPRAAPRAASGPSRPTAAVCPLWRATHERCQIRTRLRAIGRQRTWPWHRRPLDPEWLTPIAGSWASVSGGRTDERAVARVRWTAPALAR